MHLLTELRQQCRRPDLRDPALPGDALDRLRAGGHTVDVLLLAAARLIDVTRHLLDAPALARMRPGTVPHPAE